MANLIKNPGIIVNSKKFKQLIDRSITTVTAEDLAGMTNIGNSAFYTCISLASITIPNSVTRIGGSAFSGCIGLTNITIPNSVTNVGSYAFDSCSSLTSIMILATNPPTLGTNTFQNTNNCPIYVPIQSLNAYKTATNWSSLASRIQPIPSEGLEYHDDGSTISVIGRGTCTDSYIVIPGSYNGKPVTKIYNNAFYEDTIMENIYIPDTVTVIDTTVFYKCTNLTSIVIPDSVTTIGPSAIRECTSLSTIVIGTGITEIGNLAFYDCTNLQSITVKATSVPTLVGYYALNNTNECPIYVPSESVTAYQGATNWDYFASRIQAITTP